ncbi:NADH dehydrogenase subunit 5 [Tanacetum coccineum]|uniref:NADH dehydrogenase subunit 5 n=17 Tax=campanulids TaxID=91882 RepID=A0ABQ4ZUW8_9ASTR
MSGFCSFALSESDVVALLLQFSHLRAAFRFSSLKSRSSPLYAKAFFCLMRISVLALEMPPWECWIVGGKCLTHSRFDSIILGSLDGINGGYILIRSRANIGADAIKLCGTCLNFMNRVSALPKDLLIVDHPTPRNSTALYYPFPLKPGLSTSTQRSLRGGSLGSNLPGSGREDHSWKTEAASLFPEEFIFQDRILVVNQYQELHDPMSYQLRDWLLGCSNPVPASFSFEKDPFKVDSKQALCNIVGSLYVRRCDRRQYDGPADEWKSYPPIPGFPEDQHTLSLQEGRFRSRSMSYWKNRGNKGTSARSSGADDSPYLLGKAKGTYWSDIRLMLEHAPSQNEYNRLLEFENKDLQIRELQHECFRLFEGFLKQNPPLSDQVPYNPQEAFKDFLNEDYEKRDQRFPFFIFDRDEKELDFLSNVRQRLKKEGPAYILAESEFAAPTITKLIPIPFSTSGASVAYNVNPVADQFQRAFQTSTFCNRLYSFFNKRWFFDQVFNDFLVRSFLRFGYEVSFEALDKGAIEILGPYGISYTFRRLAERISQLQSGFVVRRVRYDPWPPAWRQLPVLSLLSFLSSKEDCWKNRDPVFRSQQGSHREKVAIGRTCGWIESYALKFFKSGFMDKPSAKRRRNAISQSQLRSPLLTATLDRERVEVAKSGIGCTNSTDRRPSRCLWGRTDRLISSRDRRSTLANATQEEAAKIPSLTNAPA